jgi:hypothetical protein
MTTSRIRRDHTSDVRVRLRGFEPRTCGLRVRCSAIELEARRQFRTPRTRGGPSERRHSQDFRSHVIVPSVVVYLWLRRIPAVAPNP